MTTTGTTTLGGSFRIKQYLYKIYASDGTFVTTWTDVVSEPKFRSDLNGGFSELVVELARKESDFGEGVDVKYGNQIKIYAFDRESGYSGVQVYSGVLSQYVPSVKGSKEIIEVTFLSYWWELDRFIVDTGTSTVVNYTAQDPGNILRDLFDKFTSAGGKLDYSGTVGNASIYDTYFYSNANLKAYYQFSSTGDILVDSSGEGHTLTAISDPASIATGSMGGVFGRCAGLDGNDAFSAVDHADFKPTGNFSIGGWFKFTSSVANQIIFQSWSANTNYAGIVLFMSTDSKIYFYSAKNTGTSSPTHFQSVISTATYADSNWHNAIATWDGSYLHLYIDGIEIGTGTAWANAPAYAATNYVRIGCQNNSGSNTGFVAATGYLDDVFLLNGTALTSGEVDTIYKYMLSTSMEYTGSNVEYEFNTASYQEAVKKCIELSPAGFNLRVGADDIVYFEEKSATPDHYFTLGKDIEEFQPEKRTENIINTVYLRGGDVGGGVYFYKKYTDATSVTNYGTYSYKYIDEKILDEDTADIVANRIINNLKDPEIRVVIKVLDSNGFPNQGYDIESIKVGDTCRIRNATSKGSTLWDTAVWDTDVWDYDITNTAGTILQIVKIEYTPDYAVLELSNRQPDITKKIEDINRKFVDSITITNPDTYST